MPSSKKLAVSRLDQLQKQLEEAIDRSGEAISILSYLAQGWGGSGCRACWELYALKVLDVYFGGGIEPSAWSDATDVEYGSTEDGTICPQCAAERAANPPQRLQP